MERSRSPQAQSASIVRQAAVVLTLAATVQLIAAFLPKMEVFTAPTPLERLQAIAANVVGWNLQAVLFPLAFLAIAWGFGRLIPVFRSRLARIFARVATALSAAAFLCWLPISAGRLRINPKLIGFIIARIDGASPLGRPKASEQ